MVAEATAEGTESAEETAAPVDGLPPELRARMALALDVDDLVQALRLARQLSPWFGVAKVGLELFTAAGPDAVGTMLDNGFDVFLDVKLHDIPTTVGRAAAVCGALGARYLTMHAHGGSAMLTAGVEGFNEGARNAGLPEPIPVAITVLTSDADAPSHIVPNRLRLAVESGCKAIVCSGPDLKNIRELSPRTQRIVPGIRATGADRHDQPLAVTPEAALEEGADLLVIGRAVTLADDPPAAAAALFAGMF
ncbi:MAG: orotidine-5'-phosphate decarboxylase [Actinomycetia bacterium]|nr:orotidine-5'-phosphate decarboxylase [Actinomycetes bacterium]MCP4226453.1 orotidine-5'-phosphate decarboxylase [Actinomycetes bacterium]MCP5034594.1 orotidine-5'-phosphate decarboxylase [Actinomycetes bacterium]